MYKMEMDRGLQDTVHFLSFPQVIAGQSISILCFTGVMMKVNS